MGLLFATYIVLVAFCFDLPSLVWLFVFGSPLSESSLWFDESMNHTAAVAMFAVFQLIVFSSKVVVIAETLNYWALMLAALVATIHTITCAFLFNAHRNPTQTQTMLLTFYGANASALWRNFYTTRAEVKESTRKSLSP